MPKNPYPTRADPINLPRRLREGLEEAETLLERKKPQKALELLHELDRKYPRSPDVLGLTANAHLDTQNYHGYLHAIRRLHDLTPNRADVKLGLAGAYLNNGRLALALQTFRHFLKKWPQDERASDVQGTISKLETGLAEILNKLNLSLENDLDFACKHEELQVLMEAGELERCKKLAQQLINQQPDFVPPLNNLSQVYRLDGDLAAAIETVHKVLEIQPDNVHALSNLTRYLFMQGKKDEALVLAKRLKESKADAADFWIKKAEALSFIGDDQGVLALLDEAKRAKEMDALNATVYHECAVAAYRNGNLSGARKHWQKALELAPYFDLANENLKELKRPVHERLCPQAFSLDAWLPQRTIDKLSSITERAAHQKNDQAFQKQICEYMDQHPEVIYFVPAALKSGDDLSRDLALKLADMSSHPTSLSSLQEFALGQEGPDALRMEATQILSKHGIFKSGSTIDLWREGEWKSIMMMGFQISYDPPAKPVLKPAVQKLMAKAIDALHAHEGEQAEIHLRKAMEMQPNEPSLLNNLALALSMQGKTEESDALADSIPTRFPDYFFGWNILARKAMQKDDMDTAKEYIEKMMVTQEMHVTEFSALCSCQIDFMIQDKKPEGAVSWYEMWQQVYPDDPQLKNYEEKMAIVDLLTKVKEGFMFGKRRKKKKRAK